MLAGGVKSDDVDRYLCVPGRQPTQILPSRTCNLAGTRTEVVQDERLNGSLGA
jgi:hypothetical protein